MTRREKLRTGVGLPRLMSGQAGLPRLETSARRTDSENGSGEKPNLRRRGVGNRCCREEEGGADTEAKDEQLEPKWTVPN